MRWLLLLWFLVLAACGGDGQDLKTVSEPAPPAPPTPTSHAPQILELALSLDSAMYMEGNGKLAVAAVMDVADAGQDIETLIIQMANGVELSLDVSGMVNDARGTITQEFDVATTEIGTVSLRIWLVDAAGLVSNMIDDHISVNGDPYTWQQRLTGLPYTLNAVTAEGSGFVAVGDGGTIMTSDDGLTWTNEVSPTSVDLNFVTCSPPSPLLFGGCFAAGDAGTILASPTPYGDGATWTTWFDGPDDVSLNFFYWHPFASIAVGTVVTTDVARILHGDFPDGPWAIVEPLAHSGQYITDLAIRPLDDEDPLVQRYVATVEVPFPEQAKVLVSNDLLTWLEVFVSGDHGSTNSIMDRWVSGSGGKMYASDDGVNWTQHKTPATQSNLVAISNTDGFLMVHGFSASAGMGEQVGVATSDGGQTWQEFVIGTAYEPRGLAYGDGRWVSVGQSLAEPGKGAILTTQ